MRTSAVVVGAVALVAMLTSCTPASSDQPDRVVRPTAPGTAPAPSSASATTPDVSPGATASAAPEAGDVSCVDGVLAIRGNDLDVSFAGECDLVRIEGAALDVDLERARIGRVVASGDRLEIDLGSVDSLEVTGQSADVDAVVVGALAVAGDRNTVEADEIGAVSVSGNDNRVEADRLGAVTQSGDRNAIG